MKTKFTKKFIDVISKYVNIIDIIDTLEIDQNFDLLSERLAKTKRVFGPRDFYLISHIDTAYYLPSCPYSLLTFNFVRTFQQLDISLSRVIWVTSTSDYLNEFKSIIPDDMHKFNLPIVIDNCISVFDIVDINNYLYKNINVDVANISLHGLTMLGLPRAHRNALYTYLIKNNLLTKIATSYKNI